jgi:hypothetical protein
MSGPTGVMDRCVLVKEGRGSQLADQKQSGETRKRRRRGDTRPRVRADTVSHQADGSLLLPPACACLPVLSPSVQPLPSRLSQLGPCCCPRPRFRRHQRTALLHTRSPSLPPSPSLPACLDCPFWLPQRGTKDQRAAKNPRKGGHKFRRQGLGRSLRRFA